MNLNETYGFLQLLNMLSFDDYLFRKEFIKTLGWINKDDFSLVEEWMVQNEYNAKYPDLMSLIKMSNQLVAIK